MPPKASKKKGKGAGKKSPVKKAGSPTQDELTFKEAVLQYRLQLKYEQISDIEREIEDLKKLCEDQKQRNEALNSKKEGILEQVASKLSAVEGEKSKLENTFDFEMVERALLETFHLNKAEEISVQEEEEKVDLIENLIANQIIEIEQRCHYRDVCQFEDFQHIASLENEREAMNVSFYKISGQLQANISDFKEEICSYAEKTLSEQQAIAEKEVIRSLDTANQIELINNSLLKNEISLHRKLYDEELQLIESLEEENLSIIEDLLDCNLADIKVMRRFYADCSGHSATSVQPQSGVAVVPIFDTEVCGQNNEMDDDIETDIRLLCVIGKQKTIHEPSSPQKIDQDSLTLDFESAFKTQPIDY